MQVVLYISKTVFATKRGGGAQHKLNNFDSVAVTVNITDMYMHWSFLNFAEQRVGLRLCVWDSTLMLNWNQLCYSADVDSRTQGSRPRPRTQKNPRPRTALPRTDPLEAKDRNARGQGQGPRTLAQVFSKKEKVFKKFVSAISKTKKSSKIFSGFLRYKAPSKWFFSRFANV